MDDFFYDAARQHIQAQLTSSICESKGLILVTGEHGVGKTILLRHLAEELEVIHGVVLLPPSGVVSCEGSPTFDEIIEVCRTPSIARHDGSGDVDDETGVAELLERVKKANATVALILDDADQLQLQALEHLKALSKLSIDERGRLSIVLSGCLDTPNEQNCSAFEAARLNADVSLQLQRFQGRDVEPYICHRIRLAGRKGPEPFAPSAIDRIIRYSGGNPLSINWICSSALVFASRKAIKTVTAEIVDAVVAGGLGGTTADGSPGSGKRFDHISDPDVPLVPRGNAPDFINDQSTPPIWISETDTPAAEDVGDKFHFEGETGCDEGRATQNAALASFPNSRPTEEIAQEEPVGWWSQDRTGIVLRFVWIFLVATLVVGVGGVYLTQTGQFDAIEFSKRWLAQISGDESTLPQNDARGSGFVDGRPTRRVEPSSKLAWEYSLETKSHPSSGKARQIPEEQRQAIEEPLQVSVSAVERGSEARSNETFSATSLSVASRLIAALDAAIEKAGPEWGSRPVTETNGPINLPPLAVATNSGVEIDETIKIPELPVEIEPLIRPGADEAGGHREVVQDSSTATEPGDTVERGGVAVEAGTAAEADPAEASEAVPAEMETSAGTEDGVKSGELAVEAGGAAETGPAAAGEAVPGEMETSAGTDEMVESGELAVEAGSAAEADPAAASEAVPAEMDTSAGTEDGVKSGELAVEAGGAAETGPAAASEAVPGEMETSAGTDEMVESGEVAVEAGAVAEADPAEASEAVPAEMETSAGTDEMVESGEVAFEAGAAAEAGLAAAGEAVAGTEDGVKSGEVAVEAGSAAEADPAAASEAVPGIEDGAKSGEVAVEAGAAVETDPAEASEAVPAEMETSAGTEEANESPVLAVEAEAGAGSIKVTDAPAFPVETRTKVGSEEAAARLGVVAKTESHSETNISAEIVDVPADKIGIENDGQGRSTESVPEARASDHSSTDAGPAASGPLLAGENIRREAVSPDFETPSEPRQLRRGGVPVQENGSSEASKRGKGKDTTLAAQLDGPLAEQSISAVNDDGAADLRSALADVAAREVSLPVIARADLPKLRDQLQGRSEPQAPEPEVPALGEPPMPSHVAETTQPQLDVDRLLDRGDQLLALGDVASARLFYRLAANKGSAKGATAMGSTYDPVYLERIGFVGARPSPAEAIKWYRQAIDMGHRGAEVQLRDLTNRLQRAAAFGDSEAQRVLESLRN